MCVAEPPERAAVPDHAAPDWMTYTDPAELAAVRSFVRSRALAFGLSPERVELLLVAVNELATNTLQHTVGGGRVRVWAEGDQVICDVVDRGPPRGFGRAMPAPDAVRGRGLAIVERICDEVTTTTGREGTLIRLRLHR